ncbi:MAG: aminopeptidase P N-terminal domain-containing protein [Cyanobacteria bacterium J06642_2]
MTATAIAFSTTQSMYQQRRQDLMQRLGKGTAILRSAAPAIANNIEYPFRQEGDFYYLTGFNEPEAVAILAPNHDEHQFVLFVQPKDPDKEIWTGYRTGVEAAKERYGADEAYPITELEEKLPQYLACSDRIFHRPSPEDEFNHTVYRHWQAQLRQNLRRGHGPTALEDLSLLLHDRRCIKSEAELDLMRRAATIAAEAHNLARAAARPGTYEYEIEALLDRHFRAHGGLGPAYPSIVASGPNACILHYTTNQRRMQTGDLLLIDAGCCYEHYNSDITRTFPINGKFTSYQKEIYTLVLAAQTAAIAEVKPGNTFNQPHDTAVRVIASGLIDLGLLKPKDDKDFDQLVKDEDYKPFYMHRTSHWLGLDVHDVGPYKVNADDWQTFQPGMVLTIEPGIYISPAPEAKGLENVSEPWRGIGIRIEDDVLVTATGYEVLTSEVPKAIADIER